MLFTLPIALLHEGKQKHKNARCEHSRGLHGEEFYLPKGVQGESSLAVIKTKKKNLRELYQLDY